MPLISKEELEEMYWGEPGTELGAPQIAKIYKCSPNTIYRRLKKYDIQIRPSTRTGSGECLTGKSKEILGEQSKEKWENGIIDMRGKKHPLYGKKQVHLRGKNNPNVKLDETTYKKIYDDIKNTFMSKTDIAKKYRISTQTIEKIIKGEHWATRDESRIYKKQKVSKKRALDVYNYYKNNNHENAADCAKKLGISESTFHFIIKGHHWATKGKKPIKSSYVKKGKENYFYGKNKSGSKNPNCKTDTKTGIKIYNEYKNKETSYGELAKKYGLSKPTVGRIVQCRHWTTEHLKEGDK